MWLLKSEVFAEMRAAMAGGLRGTAEQQAQFVAARGTPRPRAEAPENYAVAGDTAQINVLGVLSPRPSFLLWLLGYEQTTYADIQSSLSAAASDSNVQRVVMVVDSPGGTADGLFDTLAALEAFGKPISVTAACACSAAYAIAAASGPITATNAAAEFGSVGVAVSVPIDDETIDITSTEAPHKRPDVSTDEGQAVIREHLDAIHELFAEAIAGGRGTSVARVNTAYGRGATLLAGAAQERGMIDGIAAKLGSSRTSSAARAELAAEVGPHTTAAQKLCDHPGGPLSAAAIELCERGAPPAKLLDIANRLSLTAPA
jgi:ClpP class serine protease